MGFENAKTKIEYSHPNFGSGKSAIVLQFDGVFPEIYESDHNGVVTGMVQEQPKDNAGWLTRKHTSNFNDALLVNSDGYTVEMGDGAPVVKLDGVQVYP